MSGHTVTLLRGLAEYLAGAGIGKWSESSYAAADIGIRLFDVPQTPDRAITLTPYTIGDDVRTDISDQGIQIRCRGPARANATFALDLDDAIFNTLQAAEHLRLGGLVVDSIERRSSLPMGVDGSGRWEIASNYALTLSRPTLWRTQ